jgi:polyhydroxyalkanoate synthesis regulator phasin
VDDIIRLQIATIVLANKGIQKNNFKKQLSKLRNISLTQAHKYIDQAVVEGIINIIESTRIKGDMRKNIKPDIQHYPNKNNSYIRQAITMPLAKLDRENLTKEGQILVLRTLCSDMITNPSYYLKNPKTMEYFLRRIQYFDEDVVRYMSSKIFSPSKSMI